MRSPDTEALARRFIQVWNPGHMHIVDELAADTLVVEYTHVPQPVEGPAAFQEMLSQTHRYFPDLTVEASGQSVEVVGLTRYPIAAGLVQHEQVIVDTFGLMMQLGARPAQL